MPRYVDIAETIRAAVRRGDYAPSGRLPIQEELAAQFDTSTATIHKATKLLKAEGVLYTAHNGTFAGTRPERP
ncbi:winged helix-turn-helix domain-containing protein [Streptomyces albidoflavus]|uniref:winged helix-turn-helix domain-containing protein n=1 Tax=Streptomyces albidoflavus TaxID=1886 RepID=UPI00102164E1|nr:winged helix-turn-helix domain-containing protein [Streptomyces albidoflavus]RZF02911.1 hypothetical protein C0R05_32385 [Streptomyces albidoflavus]